MQEKINQSAANKTHRRYTTKEERLAYIKKWQESGLSVTEYCRQHDIALASFLGWKSAIKSKQLFKPVITSSPASETKVSSGNVIEIIAGPGIKIRLFNVTDASLAIHIARGLITCS